MSAAADGQEALDKLADAEAARLAKQAKRRQAAADAHDPGENVDDFLKVFEAEFSTIKEAIGCKVTALPPPQPQPQPPQLHLVHALLMLLLFCCSPLPAAHILMGKPVGPHQDFVDNVEKATKHFDELTERCARLNETLASASVFLPAYTFRQRSQDLASLVSDIGTARNKIAPKKKFSFKDRKKRAAAGGGKAAATAAATPPAQPEAAAAATQDADTEPAPPPHRPQEAADAFDPEYLISHAQNRTMVLREGEIGGHDYALTDLTDCVVHLLDVVGALYIKRVTRCRIVVGCVRGSLHISDLEDCAVTIAARQVRNPRPTLLPIC